MALNDSASGWRYRSMVALLGSGLSNTEIHTYTCMLTHKRDTHMHRRDTHTHAHTQKRYTQTHRHIIWN